MDAKLAVPFPPDPNPCKPRFALPANACDTHFHVFGPPHVFPFSDRRLFTPPAAPIEHYLAMAKVTGLQRGILVVPGIHGLDNAVMHDALAKAEGALRGMVRANADLSEADNRVLHARGVRGVRFNFVGQLGGRFDEAGMRHIIACLGSLPWAVDCHIEADLLNARAEFLSRIEKNVVIDHFGLVDSRKGLDQLAFRTLLDLVALPNV